MTGPMMSGLIEAELISFWKMLHAGKNHVCCITLYTDIRSTSIPFGTNTSFRHNYSQWGLPTTCTWNIFFNTNTNYAIMTLDKLIPGFRTL